MWISEDTLYLPVNQQMDVFRSGRAMNHQPAFDLPLAFVIHIFALLIALSCAMHLHRLIFYALHVYSPVESDKQKQKQQQNNQNQSNFREMNITGSVSLLTFHSIQIIKCYLNFFHLVA